MTKVYANDSVANLAHTTTSETAIINVVASEIKVGEAIMIIGRVAFTTGANCSGYLLRVREGVGTGGTVVGEATTEDVNVAGATTIGRSICRFATAYQDSPVYQLTGQQASATGNGSALNYSIIVVRLS